MLDHSLALQKTRFAQRKNVAEGLRAEDGELYWDEEEHVSLHKVAMGVLVEFFKFKNYLDVLGSSGLALRTVHVYAIALRGLIGKSLNLPLSEVELSALGDVTFRALEKSDELATVMLGGRSDRSKEGADRATLERERNAKFEMPWNAYETAKKKRDAEMRGVREGPSARSTTRQEEEELIEEDDDYDVMWMADADEN